MTNQRRINRSQGTINDSQGTINDEQGVINEKSKVDFSLTGFGGFIVFLVTFILGGAALYYGITSGQANLAATQTLTNYKLDELSNKISILVPALNRLETRVTVLETKVENMDGSATLK